MQAVLFDFFGTLVTYQPDRLNLDYAQTARLVHSWGYENASERFAEVWNAVLHTLELTTSGTHAEFSMDDVVVAYEDAEQLNLSTERRSELLDSFMSEWRVGVRPIDGVNEVLFELSGRMQIGIVSNTHQLSLVPGLLAEFGIGVAFDPIVLSIAHGHRKPHPSIYVSALNGLESRRVRETPGAPPVDPSQVLFVGDTYDADYAGPTAAGMQARLIDPHARQSIPSSHRLQSVLDLSEMI